MQLKLDMSCHLLNAYTKFQIDISKHVENGKRGRTDGRTDGQTDRRTLPRHNTSRFSNGRIKSHYPTQCWPSDAIVKLVKSKPCWQQGGDNTNELFFFSLSLVPVRSASLEWYLPVYPAIHTRRSVRIGKHEALVLWHICQLLLHAHIGTKMIFISEYQPQVSLSCHTAFTLH